MFKNTVEYKGKILKCKDYSYEVISDEEFSRIRNLWYAKPSRDEVLYEMRNFHKGNNTISKVVKYYFRDLMDEVKKYYDKWAISDVFECKDLLSYFIYKVKNAPKTFNSSNFIANLDTCFRIGGKGKASKVSNFPVDICTNILTKYNVNNNYYDASCGWGVRQQCAMRLGINYYGTDPNYKLVDKLNEFNKDYRQVNNVNSITKIYCQGSEKLIPELENKIGIAFTSPPYFNLEDYKYGEQSWNENTSYEEWVNNYLEPTFRNIYIYLIENGYMCINIKDFNNLPLEKSTIDTALKVGFKLYCVECLSQGKRLNTSGENEVMVDSSENIYIFVKNEYTITQENGLFTTQDADNKQAIRVGTTTKIDRNKDKSINKEECTSVGLW